MKLTASIVQARELLAALPRPIGFVPTMGALHAGHLALVAAARAQNASVVASLFVNPLQFGAGEDLANYPRDFAGDRAQLARAGVDILFAPDDATMYPPDFSSIVDVGAIGTAYEGALRPSHFRGVTTVVAKLLNIVGPDTLYLGQKDAQQTAVLRTMIRDLGFPVAVEIVATQREADGLALSSRNAYLSPAQRAAAPSLHRALNALHEALLAGARKDDGLARAREALDPLATPDYFDVVDADTFAPLQTLRAPAFIVGAARLGTTRLLDNLWIPQ
ncbi:MAG TPA: pantoate--beta-alanine ligase [Verrucomicrobiae bacterium]|jgi:pantoate--beta-alanine ligase|nr:pantoate--beta-alanine ligase [Verrucomicrobiae bacterium]